MIFVVLIMLGTLFVIQYENLGVWKHERYVSNSLHSKEKSKNNNQGQKLEKILTINLGDCQLPVLRKLHDAVKGSKLEHEVYTFRRDKMLSERKKENERIYERNSLVAMYTERLNELERVDIKTVSTKELKKLLYL